MIDITASPAGQKVLEKEGKDIERVAMSLEKDAYFNGLTNSLETWSESKEVKASRKQLEDFAKSYEGKVLEAQVR